MRKISLDYEQTGYFPKIILDYLSGKNSLRAFYKYAPDIASFKKVIANKKKQTVNRTVLTAVIREQYRSIQTHQKVTANINSLSEPNTFTVTTAHQPNLFTGFLYFFYKIISTINLAEQLKAAYPEVNFVPIYWMGSEDHDFEEINHIHLFKNDIEWKDKAGGAVGRLKTTSLNKILKQIKPILGDSKHAKQLYQMLEDAYYSPLVKGDKGGFKTLAEATRFLVDRLFHQYGLVIIDGDDRRLKELFVDVIEDDIFNQKAYHIVSQTIEQLSPSRVLGTGQADNYKIQVNPRQINVFYLRDGLRARIVQNKGSFEVLGTGKKLSSSELKEELKKYPERFSPNVILRPLYQERVLPNLCYVGGGGELAYWLELKSLFENYKINFPVLILRNSVCLIDKTIAEKLQKIDIEPSAIFNDMDHLAKQYVKKHSKKELTIKEEKDQLNNIFQRILAKALKIDSSLEQAVKGEYARQRKTLEKLEAKLLKAEKGKHIAAINQIKIIKEKLFPQGQLQERYENFIPYYLKYGDEFIKMLKAELNPLEKQFFILLEDI
ncbi:MAG: bacillithiol biosynthesis cysteine-adding enzyme BshC [Bacteroidetes bacterium]|nr:bacillithiol biosynthesis cysteine-adding enzyme BshC [Bacteroidota bacterium]